MINNVGIVNLKKINKYKDYFLSGVWFIALKMRYVVYNLNHVFGFKLDKFLFPIILLALAEREMTKVLKNFGEKEILSIQLLFMCN